MFFKKDKIEKDVNDDKVRVKSFDDYIGQDKLKLRLKIAIHASKERGEPLPSILLFGRSGAGKSTIANIIASEYGAAHKQYVCSGLKTKGDLTEILVKLEEHMVVFLDECHALDPSLQEFLYTAIEDFKLTIKIGSKEACHIKLKPFTLVAATNSPGKLLEPFRNRFGIVHEIEPYTDEEMAKIVSNTAARLGLKFEDEKIFVDISQRARSIPRIANRLLLRIRDYAQVKREGVITWDCVNQALLLEGIDESGLTDNDYRYLKSLARAFNFQPAGIAAISSVLGEAKESIELNIEPFLLEKNLIIKTKQGRALTDKGVDKILALENRN